MFDKADNLNLSHSILSFTDLDRLNQLKTINANCRSEAIDPAKPISQEKQARRNFAVLLANHAAGELDLTTNKGQIIRLSGDLYVSHQAFDSETIEDLIAELDSTLIQGTDPEAVIDCVEEVIE